MSVDTATLTIVGGALRAIPLEMGENLIRSAYSSVIREARDASTALLDPRGRIVAQAQLIPIHMNSFSLAFEEMAQEYDLTSFRAGEAVITNDPYRGGQHLNDIILFTPIFAADGALAGFAGSIGHHIDIGGGAAGPNSAATDLAAEGLCLPMLRIDLERDLVPEGLVGRIVRANVRSPGLVMGDLTAQIAANQTGAANLLALHAKYGEELVAEAMSEIMDYSERLMRTAIAELPDGVYEGEDVIDDDGFDARDLRVHARVTIAGSDLSVDLTRSSPEAKGSVNVPLGCTISAVYGAVAAVLGGRGVPVNDGCYRPVQVEVAPGSLLNPSPGRPVRARMLAVSRVFNALMLAFAQAAPERVIASGHDSMTAIGISRHTRDRHYVYMELLGGGYGAGPQNDGADILDVPLANCSNIPVEAIEKDYPFMRLRAHELIPGSAGGGRRRGGFGLRRVYEILEDEVALAAYSDRLRNKPWGLQGGLEGSNTRLSILRGDERIDLPSKVNVTFAKGDLFVVETAGGGGYGPPESREPELVERDLREGRITADEAREVYRFEQDTAAAGSDAHSTHTGMERA
jgi:N-methylhydantoinase B